MTFKNPVTASFNVRTFKPPNSTPALQTHKQPKISPEPRILKQVQTNRAACAYTALVAYTILSAASNSSKPVSASKTRFPHRESRSTLPSAEETVLQLLRGSLFKSKSQEPNFKYFVRMVIPGIKLVRDIASTMELLMSGW